MFEFTGVKFTYLLLALFFVVALIAVFTIKDDRVYKKPTVKKVYSFDWTLWVGLGLLVALAISLYTWAFSI